MDTSSDGWEEEFFNCLGQDSQEGEAAEDDDIVMNQAHLKLTQNLRGIRKLLLSLEEVQHFLNNV